LPFDAPAFAAYVAPKEAPEGQDRWTDRAVDDADTGTRHEAHLMESVRNRVVATPATSPRRSERNIGTVREQLNDKTSSKKPICHI